MGASLIHSLQEDQATSMIPAWPITQVSLRTVVFAKNARIVVGEVDLEGQFWKVVLFLYATNTILDKVEVSPEEEHHPPDVEQAGHEHTLYILLRWWWWWIIIFDERGINLGDSELFEFYPACPFWPSGFVREPFSASLPFPSPAGNIHPTWPKIRKFYRNQ